MTPSPKPSAGGSAGAGPAPGPQAGGLWRLRPAGDAAVLVEFAGPAGPAAHRRVLGLWESLVRRPLAGMVEAVPSYRSVLVVWDPEQARGEAVRAELRDRLDAAVAGATRRPRRLLVPVVYGGPMGPDLEEVAAYTGLEPDEVVRLHAAGRYMVMMLGFTPGFCYLGPLDRRLWVPRRATPRLRVPAGSVGIAGGQTGIYSLDDSPGGWRLIGRTWLRLWDPGRRRPALFRAGDRVRFEPVSLAQAPRDWAERAMGGAWELESA